MFSELVDDVMVRIGRSNSRVRQNVISYTHATMRECQLLGYFDEDMIEDTITATAAPFIWTKPTLMRHLRTVRYDALWNHGRFPPLVRPGKLQFEKDYYYYAGPAYFTFAGVALNDTISVAYYAYARRFTYYEVADRPAVYNRDDGTWTYHDDYDDNDALKETARGLVSNWILLDWKELIEEGILAKVYKMLREDKLAGVSFQLYKSFQTDLRKGATTESLDY